MYKDRNQSQSSLSFLVLNVVKELTTVERQLLRLVLIRTHEELGGFRRHLESYLPVPEPRVRRVTWLQRFLRTRRVRKVQLALLGLQDLRLHPIQRTWTRQYRALQGVKDLRE